jgi:NDP-sugar pyrophosphorylase family protein
MPVSDYPILEIILRQLKYCGIEEVFLAVGHMSELIQAYFKDGRRLGIKLHYSFESNSLGTAGPITSVLDQLGDDFIVMNGDLLTTLNYKKMINYHFNNKASATIAMHEREIKIDFGVINCTKEGILIGYDEKPTFKYNLGMGVNILNRKSISKYLINDQYLDMPNLMLKIKESGKKVMCYKEECFWLDIGNPIDYENATNQFDSNRSNFLMSTD